MPLIDLPNELLLRVAQTLCDCERCGSSALFEDDQAPWMVLHETHDRLSALSSLSRACRRLASVIQPVLFQHIYHTGEQLSSLTHTFTQRSGLAASVREIHLMPWNSLLWELGYNDMVVLNHLQSMPLADSRKSQFAHMMPELAQHGSVSDIIKAEQDCARAFGASCSLALLQTPKLRHLYLSIPSWPGASFSVNSLPCLTQLALDIYTEHYPQYAVDIEAILLAAPNLVNLSARYIRAITHNVQHDKLAVVELHSCDMKVEDLRTTIKGFSKLRAFAYRHTDPDRGVVVGASPREVADIISDRSSTLKSLELRFSSVFCYSQMYDENIPQPDPIKSLKHMTQLETLSIDRFTISSTADNIGPCKDNLFLELLPSSIQRLTILVPGKCHIPALLRLADEIGHAFPLLRRLVLAYPRYSDDEIDALKASYLAKGVIMEVDNLGH